MQDLHHFDPYHLSWTESSTYKTPCNSPGQGGTVLEALAFCVFPSAWKENKAISLFLQNLCLHISVRHLCTGKPIFRQQSEQTPRQKRYTDIKNHTKIIQKYHIIRELQIKIMRYHTTPIRTAKLQKYDNTNC